jgi:hypothetical protein
MVPPVEDVFGYKEEDIVLLLDDGVFPEPTRLRIVRNLSTVPNMEVIRNISTLD